MDELNGERMEEAYDEADLSDDVFEEDFSFDDLLDRVESNDPSLTKLKVRLPTLVQSNVDGHLPQNDDRLDRMSVAIGRNTHLKAVSFDESMSEARLKNLFLGVACNESIKRFYFDDCVQLENVCSILTSLFKNNQVELIWINNCHLSLDSIRLLATSLAMFDSLKAFALTSNTIRDEPDDSQQVARDLVQSLAGHSRLRKLDLLYTNVGKLGCSTLVDLLHNPNINLSDLDLTCNNLGDTEADLLASGMAGNTSMKEINLIGNVGITQAGWQALFAALSDSRCRLERLSLSNNEINDAAAGSLSSALTSITTLRTLNLRCISSITIAGWRVLFDFLHSQTCTLEDINLDHNQLNDAAAQCLSTALASNKTIKTLNLGRISSISIAGWRVLLESLRSPNCPLEDLDLHCNQLNDEVITSLTDALASNRSLKSLNLNGNDEVTGAAWQRFFPTALANPNSGLEKLDLGFCGISDTALSVLTNALVNNSKLKVLDLSNNNQVTNSGWAMLSSVLDSPNTALEELDLQGTDIDDNTAALLVNSLAGNKKLKELYFWHSDAWEPPLDVLYNAASIMSTYNSNHIFETLGYEVEGEFESLLQVNRGNSPSQAARLKIIKAHFSEGFITQPFVGMDLNVLPRAMAWMGRDGRRSGEVDGHYFCFIKSISSLFENVKLLS